jgi:hypothetical protein
VIDRLAHHCHIIETGNDSFRFKDSVTKPKSRKDQVRSNLTVPHDSRHIFNPGQISVDIDTPPPNSAGSLQSG